MNFNSHLKMHELMRKRRSLVMRMRAIQERQRMEGAVNPIRALLVQLAGAGEESEETAEGNIHSLFKAPPNQ